jgi:archaellum component FlaG (FlaF/FlaG flagellin family)
VGLVNDSTSVAIIRLGGVTYIVAPGDVIKDRIRVTAIDAEKRVVVLEEEGERFELKMGEVRARHVAATSALGRN